MNVEHCLQESGSELIGPKSLEVDGSESSPAPNSCWGGSYKKFTGGRDFCYLLFFKKITEKILIILSRETMVQFHLLIQRQWIHFPSSLKDGGSAEAVPAKQYPLYMVCSGLTLWTHQD